MGLYFTTKLRAYTRQNTNQPTPPVSRQVALQSKRSHHTTRTHASKNTFAFPCPSALTIFIISAAVVMLHDRGTWASEITIENYGVKQIKHGDTAMVFYANASHRGKAGDKPIIARLFMESCCFKVPPNNSNNCDAMKLISGLGIVFHPNETSVLYMYFVNYDLYDREGSCVLRLLTRPSRLKRSNQDITWQRGQDFTIPFNTVLTKPGILEKLFISLGASSNGYRVCNSDNYNALHECTNYNDCLIRYEGTRSLFSKESKACEPTPACSNGESYFLSIITQKCQKTHDIEHLRKSFTYEMMHVNPKEPANAIAESAGKRHHLSSVMNKINRTFSKPSPKLVCENGVHTTGKNGVPNCTCFSGWRSLTKEEWEKKGGVMDSTDGSIPYHHMCNVPLVDPKTRGLLILAFVIICISVPFVALVMCNRSQEKGAGKRKGKRTKEKIRDKSPSSSEQEDEQSDDDVEKQSFKTTKSSSRNIDEMEEDEAERVISEITNRREPTVSKKPSKGEDGDDDAEPPPPLTSLPSVESKASQTFQNQRDKASNVPSKSTLPSTGSSNGHPTSGQTMPPSSAAPSNELAVFSKPPIAPKTPTTVQAHTVPLLQNEQHHEFTTTHHTSSERLSFSSQPEDLNINLRLAAAALMPSMDELLSMNPEEMWSAHVPMSPKPGEEKKLSVVMANCATVELMDNNIILHSMSSEEITERKKEEWAQFIQSMRDENFTPAKVKSSRSLETTHQTTMQNSVLTDDDDEEVEEYSRPHPDTVFKDLSIEAVKVKSVPGMMAYHQFSSSAETVSSANRSVKEKVTTIDPPSRFVQKAFATMQPEELSTRQECYRILSSLSKERVWPGEGTREANSIWSNVASENTKELSATPATTAPESRLTTSCEEGVGDDNNDSTMLRTKTIYGDLGSDVDSDSALEELAEKSLVAPIMAKRAAKSKQVVFQETNRTVSPTFERLLTGKEICNENSNDSNVDTLGNVANQNRLESDTIPSDAYASDSGSSRVASRSVSTTEFWKLVMAGTIGGTAVDSESELSPQTSSAYQIKSSLETALKASRSRSATSLSNT